MCNLPVITGGARHRDLIHLKEFNYVHQVECLDGRLVGGATPISVVLEVNGFMLLLKFVKLSSYFRHSRHQGGTVAVQ